MRVRQKRRKRPTILVPVASIGDIAFLLIIFFMLTSNFIKEASVKVTPPTSVDLQQLQMTAVSVAIDENAQLLLNGDPVPDTDALESLISEKLAPLDADKRVVIFRCHKDIRAVDTYQAVLGVLAESGAKIALVGETTTTFAQVTNAE